MWPPCTSCSLTALSAVSHSNQKQGRSVYAHLHSPYCANSPYFYRGADWVPQAPCHGHGLFLQAWEGLTTFFHTAAVLAYRPIWPISQSN